MKAVILLLLITAPFAFGETVEFPLDPNMDDSRDYGEQLVKKFNALLETNKDLKAQFAAYEAAPKERAGGRYLGAEARPLLLHQSVEVDFRSDGGRRDYTQTVVIYYSFAEGFHKGMEETTGVFAVFHLASHQAYDHEGDGDFKLVEHTVNAKFAGFRRTLNAEQSGADQPATAPESNPEGDSEPHPVSEGRSQ